MSTPVKRMTNAALNRRWRWLVGRINGLDRKRTALAEQLDPLREEICRRRAWDRRNY